MLLVDVYRIQTSMTLAGNLAPDLAKMLKTMSALEQKAKGVEKAVARWGSPADRAASSVDRFNKALSGAHRGASGVEKELARISRALTGFKGGGNGLDREMAKWASAIGKPLVEMRTMRRETQGVASAARGVTSSISGWTSRINSAAGAMRKLQSAAQNVNLPSPGRMGGGRGGAGSASPGGTHGGRRGAGGRRGHGGGHGGLAGHEGSALAGIVGVTGGVHLMENVAETGIDMRHIELGMRQTGANPEQIAHARSTAYKGSQDFPNLSPLEIFEHINDLRGILGDIDKATHEAPDILPEFAALKAKAGNKGAKTAVSEIYTAVKSAESANEITADGVKKHVNSLTRLAFWYGDQLNPSKYFSAQKSAGQMLNLTSDRFRYGPFAALTQEIGQRAGTQFGTFAAKGIAGLRMQVAGLDEAKKMGLLQPNTIQLSKTGRVKPGAQFSDTGLDGKTYDRAADPDLWLYNNVIPKLKAGGIDTDNKADLLRELGKIFTDKNAYGFLFELAQQKNKLEKDSAGFAGTLGDTTRYRKEDPYAVIQGTKSQANAVATALSDPGIPLFVQNLTRINAALGGLADTLEKHPVVAEAGFGLAGAAAGGVATAGATALALAAVTTLSVPALAIGAGAAVTIATLSIPWDKIWASMGFGPGIANGAKTDHGVTSNPSDMLPGVASEGKGPYDIAKDKARAAGTQGLGLSPENVAASIDQAAAALGRTSTVAPPAATGLESSADGLGKVSAAAGGVPGVLNAAAAAFSNFISKMNATAVAAPAGAAPAVPGKQSSVIHRGGSAPIHVATSVQLDGRTVGRSVTRHQVAEANTRNGTGLFDDNSLKTPVGYSGPTVA
ncbi:hypothetical protein MKK55_04690 [Methylobacterium sp. J-059]|uniref:hypothetical protein n=1 Tax=Methylobacterium sp. J-059 TaxID=2836643 RepID=UPI001FBB8325|nr:hypothetical protein [Methylobacterium sp. J-059]MCJ2038256.1 hypothetical protein [Methylobacterium sp. J-059]